MFESLLTSCVTYSHFNENMVTTANPNTDDVIAFVDYTPDASLLTVNTERFEGPYINSVAQQMIVEKSEAEAYTMYFDAF